MRFYSTNIRAYDFIEKNLNRPYVMYMYMKCIILELDNVDNLQFGRDTYRVQGRNIFRLNNKHVRKYKRSHLCSCYGISRTIIHPNL